MSQQPPSVIALDGPAASGKSAVGVALAERLGFRFFDTGAMYRAMTWIALRRGISPDDEARLTELAESAQIDVREAQPGSPEPTIVLIDGEDATPHLRDPEVEANVSLVSRVPGVRVALVRLQRQLADRGSVVMAGRDIGTVVLPDAGLKVYLDASQGVRAMRRAAQMRQSGAQADVAALTEEIARRDGIDSRRTTSPLTPAPGAVIINTDDLTIEEVVQRVLNLAG